MDLQALFADRIGGARFGTTGEIYKFEKIKRAKAAARQAHPGAELLDFGVGEPDQLAPAPIRRAQNKTHRRSARSVGLRVQQDWSG